MMRAFADGFLPLHLEVSVEADNVGEESVHCSFEAQLVTAENR